MRFSAVPKNNTDQARPSDKVLNKLAKALTKRGCEILDIGRFAVSCDSSEEIFKQLEANLGKNDLALLERLEVAPPPIYFGHRKIDGEFC